MKAARLHRYDESIPADSLQVEEIEEPKIEGPLDVIVRIGGAGLCRTDLHIIEGQWAPLTGIELPYILGHENAGWVHEVGSAVSHVEVGDAVILHPLITCGLCRACRDGDDMHCENQAFPGIDTNGGFAELLKTNGRAGVKMPEGVEPLDVAGRLGADETVVADGSHVDRVMEMTGGRGVEVVLDFVGEMGAEKDGWNMTANAGSHFMIGYGGTVEVPTIDIISTERNIIGNLVGTYNDLAELMTLQAQGKVSLQTYTYSLDAVQDAVNDLNNGRLAGGRGILIPEGAAA